MVSKNVKISYVMSLVGLAQRNRDEEQNVRGECEYGPMNSPRMSSVKCLRKMRI